MDAELFLLWKSCCFCDECHGNFIINVTLLNMMNMTLFLLWMSCFSSYGCLNVYMMNVTVFVWRTVFYNDGNVVFCYQYHIIFFSECELFSIINATLPSVTLFLCQLWRHICRNGGITVPSTRHHVPEPRLVLIRKTQAGLTDPLDGKVGSRNIVSAC
jgi:hypothetical protein